MGRKWTYWIGTGCSRQKEPLITCSMAGRCLSEDFAVFVVATSLGTESKGRLADMGFQRRICAYLCGGIREILRDLHPSQRRREWTVSVLWSSDSPPRFLVSQNDHKYDDGRRREGVRMVTYEYSYDHSLAESECPFGPDSENIPHKMFVVRYHDIWLWYDGVTW